LLLLGVLIKNVSDARQYYFGTSQESVERESNDQMNERPPPRQPPPPPHADNVDAEVDLLS
jgi:hypothetical protein